MTKILKKIKNIQPKLIGVGPRSVVVELTHTLTEKKKMKIRHKSMRSDNTVSSFIWKFFVQRRHISYT